MKHVGNYKNRWILLSICITLVLSLLAQSAFAGGRVVKEVLLKVKPNIIVLPENLEIERVPVKAARVRSTDLRTLNNLYGVVSIERLFEVQSKRRDAPLAKGVFASERRPSRTVETVDLKNLVTHKRRAKISGTVDREGKEVVPIAGIYLLQMEFDPGSEPSMSDVIAAYSELDVVLHAEHILRKK